MTSGQRAALLVTLLGGTVLRLHSLVTATPSPDAFGYIDLAEQMRWSDPWRAGAREPLWIAFVKLTTGPFGYSVEAIQVAACGVGILALVACVWALRELGCRGWVVVAGTAAVATSERLIATAGHGTRETWAVLASALAVGIAARSPRWLPVLGAVLLAVRWELGLALLVVSAALAIGRVLPLRWLAAGGGVALVLMGPFVINNAREYDDPLWHSDIHATFYANLEDTKGEVLLEPLLPPDERIRPDIVVPMYRAPLVSWGEFVTDVIGPAEFARREAKAAVVLPVDALRLGWLPWPVGAILFGGAVVGAARRRDRAVAVMAGLSTATVLGYGMILPYFDRRLVSHLTVLLVLLLCAAFAARPAAGGAIAPD